MAKIFGFEIKRATEMAVPSVVPSKVQNTKPSLPLRQAYPRVELGDSGTRTSTGFIHEEYNPSLQGVQGIKVFDEMRKSDGTVRSAVLVTSLPIRRAMYIIKQGTQDTSGEEIKDFVEKNLFEWLDLTFQDVIRQALLMVPFGVMVFEKVYGIREYNGKKYVVLTKLAPRMPKSIQQWELSDGTFGIQQIRQDGQIAEIPGSKLLIFVNEREGDNWWGNSMLRAAYKHWYFKNNFYKIDAVAFERQGLGVPMMKMPLGYTVSDEAKAKQALQNLRANENAYMLLPNGYEFEFANMGSSTTRDPENSISHHNREIVKSVLAQFLELGAGQTGSKALSQDHTELFLKSLEAIADTIVSEINQNLVKELVDLNFDNIEEYPKLDYAGISKVDVKALSDAYSSLVTAGAINPTDDDQQYLRAVLGLPERSEEDIVEDDAMEDETPNGVDEVPTEDESMEEKPTPEADPKEVDTTIAKKASDHIHGRGCGHDYEDKKRIFEDGKGFSSWRPLTFAEEKVSWKKIEDTMNKLEADFSAEAKEMLKSKKDDFMAKLHIALDAGDTNALKDLEVKFVSDYKALLKEYMKKAYEYGKNNVSTEMGVPVPPNTAATLANIDLMADTTANKLAADIETKAKNASAHAIKQNANVLQAVGTIDLALETLINKSVDSIAGVMVGQSINTGRNDVFQRNTGLIHALQRSEILDSKTCNFCLSMDGLTVDPTDKWAKADNFHDYCRGIWVEILKDEQGSESIEVTGVPNAIGDLYGWQPNSLVQPKKPIVDKGSPAEKEAIRQEKARQKKK